MTIEPVSLLQTALHGRHVAANARMVDFGGWSMPIQYARGIVAEHHAVRSAVGVFDLSHMGRLYISGSDAHALVQWLATNDVARLSPGRAQYSLICGNDGRILDDIVVYNFGAELLLVVNASNREKVLAWISDQRASGPRFDATIDDQTLSTTMIGVQGPSSEDHLQPRVSASLANLRYYAALAAKLDGAEALVARTGYTGEDGFEVITSAEAGPGVWDRLLEVTGGIIPAACGLGARDTLRLEAGMPLYGHEIDETTNPYEAGLGRVVKLEKGDFVSRVALSGVVQDGVQRRLIAFQLAQPGVPRQGYPILVDGRQVGRVTSGNMSPTLEKPIGMGYVPAAAAEIGQEVGVEIRGRSVPARVVSLPFYQHRTKRIVQAEPKPKPMLTEDRGG